MHEVEALLLEAAEQHRPLTRSDGVPPHVRQDGRVELRDGPGPFAETLRVVPPLHAEIEHDLHPDTDAEHRASPGETALDELVSALGAQRRHHRVEGPDARHHEPVRVPDEPGIRGEPRIGACRDQRLDGGVDVARPVVQDGDGRAGRRLCHRAPFVLGMPSTRGSKAFAWRNARAKALYSASAM